VKRDNPSRLIPRGTRVRSTDAAAAKTRTAVTGWIGPEQLAEELGVPLRTIYAWRSTGKGPRAARFGKHLRFARVDVDAWTEQQKDQLGGAA
jgi:excisionase family DNA binding protein